MTDLKHIYIKYTNMKYICILYLELEWVGARHTGTQQENLLQRRPQMPMKM